MPIDVRLVRNEEGSASACRWQMLRRACRDQHQHQHCNHEENTTIELVMGLDQKHREAQKRLEQYKKSCRQERKRPNAEKLDFYQKEFNDLAIQLRRALWTVANAIDETLLEEMKQTTLSKTKKEDLRKKSGANSILSNPYSRLIELGALERIGNLEGNENRSILSGMLCWSSLGLDWSHALSRQIVSVTKPLNMKHMQVLQLPEFLPLEGDDLHDMLGCSMVSTQQCPICSSKSPIQIQAPSWLAYLKMNYAGQVLGDKNLPKALTYSTVSNTTAMTGADSADCFIDPREQQRRASVDKHQFPSTSSALPYTVHHALVLTSATWTDSRGAQQVWIKMLMEFYLSLIKPGNSQDETFGIERIRQRVVSPSDLVPGEASRVVVEGCIPLQNEKYSGIETDPQDMDTHLEKDWVVLGYMSNFLDYPTRACRIKSSQQHFCHVLHGTICSVPETMMWQAQNSAQALDGGMQLSETFADFFPNCHIEKPESMNMESKKSNEAVLPKLRSLGKTVNGRLQFHTVKRRSSDVPDQHTAQSNQKTNAAQDGPHTKSKGTSIPQQLDKPRRVMILQQPPTFEQIQQESLSSPHDFLPFYR